MFNCEIHDNRWFIQLYFTIQMAARFIDGENKLMKFGGNKT